MAEQRRTPNQQGVYAKVAAHADEILDVLFDKLQSRNESVALGAAKILINKILPDLKQTELTGLNGEPIQLNIIGGADYLSALRNAGATSTASFVLGSPETQSTGVAPTRTKNHDSNQPDRQVESA